MKTETKLDLNEETVGKIRELLRVNIDSYQGLEHAAESIDDTMLANVFRQIATERRRHCQELEAALGLNLEETEASGSALAAAHRLWMDFRQLLGGGAPALLEEAERGEDAIMARYQEILKEAPGTAMNDIFNRQFMAVKKSHDRIREIRDAVKN